jgi:hypothetical protein
MTKAKTNLKLVTEYPVIAYKCGLRAGNQVRLKKEIVVRDHKGKPTGTVHRKGEVWLVLRGAKEKPVVVWLRQPNGQTYLSDDDKSIFETFELV